MKLGDYMVLFVKGVIIGIGINISSISIGVLLLILNLYKKVIYNISNFKNFKNNFKYILAILLGIFVGFISGNKFINYMLVNANMPLMIFFIGLIYGGISLNIKNIKRNGNIFNFITMLISFILMLGLNFIVLRSSNVLTGLMSLFIPGLGISYLFDFISSGGINIINILLLLLGFIFISKVINYLLVKIKNIDFIILGLIMASIVMILYNTNLSFGFVSIVMSMFTFGWGFLLSKAIDKE